MRFGVGIPTGCEGMYTPCSFAGREELVVCSQMAERANRKNKRPKWSFVGVSGKC